MGELGELLEAMRDPQMRHAALVHLPVALSMLAVLPLVVLALMAGRHETIRWVALATCALLVLTALIAVNSGEGAEEELGDVPTAVHEIVEEHEEMSKLVWIFALGTGVLAGLTTLRPPWIRVTCAWLAVVGALATAAWVSATAHHGGELVYEWGVGVPAPERRKTPAPPGRNGPDDPRVVFFREHVRPILGDNCTRCHNPARKKRSGNLDQTTIAGILAGGDSGPVVVPGQPDASLLIRAIRGADEETAMPPDEEDRLGEEAIAVLERWVRDGAVGE